MSVYKRDKTWWYSFIYAGRRVQESAKTTSKTVASKRERDKRRELEEGLFGTERSRKVQTIAQLGAAYLKAYRLRNKSVNFAIYALRHLEQHLGSKMANTIDVVTVVAYQSTRLEEHAAPKSINDEVRFLLRMLDSRGDLLRAELKRKAALKLKVGIQPGKAYTGAEKDALMAKAAVSTSPLIRLALALALNAGMRDGEIRRLTWAQVDLVKRILTVGKSKTAAGEGRTIPLNSEIYPAFVEHASWYARKFGQLKPNWYVFPFGRPGRLDPTRHVTSLRASWGTVRKRAEVEGRWHDTRHTLITELAESGAGDETIMAIAGHVSRQMLTRYSHIRTEAKRTALEDVHDRRQTERVLRVAAEKDAKAQAPSSVN